MNEIKWIFLLCNIILTIEYIKYNTSFFNYPLGWHYHKIMCEIGWKIRNINNWNMYYHHLNKMCDKYRINLYGQPL